MRSRCHAPSRLAKEWDAEAQRRTAQRNRDGMQFQRGAPEAAKKLPAGLSSSAGAQPVLRAPLH